MKQLISEILQRHCFACITFYVYMFYSTPYCMISIRFSGNLVSWFLPKNAPSSKRKIPMVSPRNFGDYLP